MYFADMGLLLIFATVFYAVHTAPLPAGIGFEDGYANHTPRRANDR